MHDSMVFITEILIFNETNLELQIEIAFFDYMHACSLHIYRLFTTSYCPVLFMFYSTDFLVFFLESAKKKKKHFVTSLGRLARVTSCDALQTC